MASLTAQEMPAQEIAERSRDAMWSTDRACQALAITVTATSPGTATLSMRITDAMVNGHGLAHGGYIFTLADSAFAYACNSYNQRCVAAHCQISYIAPGKLGMVLVAEAREKQRAGRSGIYDITVRDEAGTTIAEFRGHARTIEGTLF
jgi:acyl-CoA thioesterase